MPARNFSEALQREITRSGMSAYRVSQLAGLGRAAISKLLDPASRTTPMWPTVVRLSRALDVDLSVFVTPDILADPPPPVGRPGRPAKPKKSS